VIFLYNVLLWLKEDDILYLDFVPNGGKSVSSAFPEITCRVLHVFTVVLPKREAVFKVAYTTSSVTLHRNHLHPSA